ncbi:hypothetical protein DNTS_029398 [Danionella cerebrum]|uniref:Uncharacterized protein n=1 Tax=Danionella cerebrum TaxID=2873325 RepID=A0A553QUN5_9TELE|nr:hypothetical protein DNTS_029398 [Danionella translucida]
MLRLCVFLAAVICSNGCRVEEFSQDTTDNPAGCSDSDGNFHEFQTEWENGSENCVCANRGIICCENEGSEEEPAEEPEAASAEESESASAEEPEAPSAEQSESASAEEPVSASAEESESASAEEPESASAEESESASAEKSE